LGAVAGVLAAHAAIAGEMPKRTAIEFLDTRAVEHTHFLERRVTPIRKHPSNPIIADCHSAQTVLKGDDGRLRMWYATRRKIPNNSGSAREYTIRYAESTDGIKWTLPSLGLKEFDGSKDNNVVLVANDVDAAGRPMGGRKGAESISIIDHQQTPSPHARGRFTALIEDGSFIYSDDGLRWTAYPENPCFDPRGSDTFNNIFFDPRVGHFALLHRPHPHLHAGWPRVNRLVARIDSEDFVLWDMTTAQVVLDTDDRDAPAVWTADKKDKRANARGRDKQFYGMTATVYQDFYIGFAQLLDETRRVPGWMDVRLVHSFDGIEWRREPNDTPIVDSHPEFGHWDSGCISFLPTGTPVRMGDDLHFYYSAFNMSHGYKMMTNDKTLKMRLGLGIIKRGRLVGYHAGDDEGELITRPFVLGKPNLLLNANASGGQVRAALAHGDGRPVPGCTRDDCEPITQDGLDMPLRWKGKGDLGNLVGQQVRLRIAARNAAIYAVRMVHNTGD